MLTLIRKFYQWSANSTTDPQILSLLRKFYQWSANSNTDPQILPMLCKFYYWSANSITDPQILPLICKFYYWSANSTTDLQILPLIRKFYHWSANYSHLLYMYSACYTVGRVELGIWYLFSWITSHMDLEQNFFFKDTKRFKCSRISLPPDVAKKNRLTKKTTIFLFFMLT